MKKGFTLIELLAVIIILGVIAVIVVPSVNSIITRSKAKSFLSSAQGILKSAEIKVGENEMDGVNTPITLADLSYKGKRYESGVITFNDEERISISLWDETIDKCAVKGYETNFIIDDTIETEAECLAAGGGSVIVEATPDICFTFDAVEGEINEYNPLLEGCGFEVIIPSEINDVPVERIGCEAFEGYGLTSVVLPEGLLYIEGSTFRDNILTSLTIPSTVIEIEDNAFRNNRITTLVIPNSVGRIDRWSFEGNGLTSLTLGTGLTEIGNWAFANNELTTINIPVNVTEINSAAFNNNLLPDDQAFIYARNSDGSIDNTTLMSYGGATKDNIIIPNSVETLECSAFKETQIESITLGTGLVTIYNHVFEENYLTSIIIPDSVEYIGDYAFEDNQLNTLVLGEGIMEIDEGAFYSNQLTSVVIPNSLTTIGASAFGQNQITSLNLGTGLLSIDDWAFGYNTLTSISLPSSLTSIEASAFIYNQLSSITMLNGTSIIGENLLTSSNNSFRDSYLIGGAGTYLGTQEGTWTKQ